MNPTHQTTVRISRKAHKVLAARARKAGKRIPEILDILFGV